MPVSRGSVRRAKCMELHNYREGEKLALAEKIAQFLI